MADFTWSWPTKIERDVIERALTLDFLPEARNLILVGTNGLGKTMIAQNICHQAVLAGPLPHTTDEDRAGVCLPASATETTTSSRYTFTGVI